MSFYADEAGEGFNVRDFGAGEMVAQKIFQACKSFIRRVEKSLRLTKFLDEKIRPTILALNVHAAAKSSAAFQDSPRLRPRRIFIGEDVKAIDR